MAKETLLGDNEDRNYTHENFIANFSQIDEDSRLLVVFPALLHLRWSDSVTQTENPSYLLQSAKDYGDFLRRILNIVAQEENPTEKELDLFVAVASVLNDLKEIS